MPRRNLPQKSQLPAEVEADLAGRQIGVEILREQRAAALMLLLDLTPQRLGLREQLADRHLQLRLGLQHARAGDLQRQIVVVGLGDQSIEGRGIEDRPPGSGRRVLGQRRRGLIDPVRGDAGGGPLEVRADLAGTQRRERHGERGQARKLLPARNEAHEVRIFPASFHPAWLAGCLRARLRRCCSSCRGAVTLRQRCGGDQACATGAQVRATTVEVGPC